jgi:hypothetical protein
MAKLKKETIDALSRKPILTTDMSKVKSYQDSLYAYNIGRKMREEFLKFANKNDITFVQDDDNIYKKPIGKINKNLKPQSVARFWYDGNDQRAQISGYFGQISQEKENQLQDFLSKQIAKVAPSYDRPIQPYVYGFEKQKLNPISPIASKEIDIENEELKPIELKNKKVSLKEPEHWLDITELNGKGTQRMYFESKEEKETFMKENPMLRIGQNTTAKLKPEILQMLKNKK